MSANPAAQSQLDKRENNVTQAAHASNNLFYRPETGDVICIKPEASAEFENEWRLMMRLVDSQSKSSEAYSSLLEQYGQLYKQNSNQAGLKPLEKQVTDAEQKMLADKKALADKIGEFSAAGTGYESVVELIPVMARKRRRGESGGKHYVYVKKGYFDRLQQGRKTESYNLHSVQASAEDRQSAADSIISYDRHGNRHYDFDKLGKQLLKFKVEKPDLAMEFLKYEDIVDIEETLTDFAESWNQSLLLPNKEFGSSLDVSAGAQFLRFVSNVSSKGEFDPYKGNLSYKGEASAVLSVAEGVAEGKYYFPDRLGWDLKFKAETANGLIDASVPGEQKLAADAAEILNMGQLRAYVSCALSGFIGASAQAEAQIQIVTYEKEGKLRQALAGRRESNPVPFSQRRSGREFYDRMDKSDEGIDANVELFAGGRATLGISGGVEWLEPKGSADLRNLDEDGQKDAAEFVTFCTISEDISAMYGLGIGGQFKCDFIKGKFCFKIAASLCCGPGVKGAFKCEVGYENIINFGAWMVYQLYSLDYHHLKLISTDAFKSFSMLCVMGTLDGIQSTYDEFIKKAMTVQSVAAEYGEVISGFINDLQDQISASERRNQLASRVIAMDAELLKFTPESKGILIYLLTRHGKMDKLDWDNYGNGPLPDLNANRKSAIITILRSIQTRREWDLVFRRISFNGNPLNVSVSVKEQELRNFLQTGFDRDDEMDKQRALLDGRAVSQDTFDNVTRDLASVTLDDQDDISIIKRRLKTKISWGYAMAMNDTLYYRLNDTTNQHYPVGGSFGPLSDGQKTMMS